MDELVIPQVDPGVADATAAIGAEEQQVTWLEVIACNQRRFNVDHFASGTRQVQASLFTEQVADEAAAIKAGVLGGTTETVAGTDQRHTTFENVVSQGWQLVRLAAGEILQFFFGCQLFLKRCSEGGLGRNLSGNRLLSLLLRNRAMSRAAKKQGHECEGHEGCEAL
ncbi:hypothetical protein D3C80_1137090 [compost metagenome]